MIFNFNSSWWTEKIRMLVKSISYQKSWKIRVLWRAGLKCFMLRRHFQRYPMSPHITPWRRHLSLFRIHMSILFKKAVIEDRQHKQLLNEETSKKVIFWLNMQFVTHNCSSWYSFFLQQRTLIYDLEREQPKIVVQYPRYHGNFNYAPGAPTAYVPAIYPSMNQQPRMGTRSRAGSAIYAGQTYNVPQTTYQIWAKQ